MVVGRTAHFWAVVLKCGLDVVIWYFPDVFEGRVGRWSILGSIYLQDVLYHDQLMVQQCCKNNDSAVECYCWLLRLNVHYIVPLPVFLIASFSFLNARVNAAKYSISLIAFCVSVFSASVVDMYIGLSVSLNTRMAIITPTAMTDIRYKLIDLAVTICWQLKV